MLITFSSSTTSGIGLETSLLFATEGSSLILADINLEAAERTASLIENKFEGKIKAFAVKCDVSKEDQIEAIVKRAVDEFGRLDVMVSRRDDKPRTSFNWLNR